MNDFYIGVCYSVREHKENFRGRYVDLRSLLTDVDLNSWESASISTEPGYTQIIDLSFGSLSRDGQDARR